MRNIFLILALLVLSSAIYIFASSKPVKLVQAVPESREQPTPQETVVTHKITSLSRKSLFVPYWTLSEKGTTHVDKASSGAGGFDRCIYFGIAPNETGINKLEAGYKRIAQFKALFSDTPSYLTLRMTDTDMNTKILADKNLSEKIIRETISTASENNFSGVVLDLETASLGFDSVTKNINRFIERFFGEVKKANLSFAIALYGDTFYRARPYDVSFIGKHADEILIMAYDFHKARGNPGPNFPLNGKEIYGYDFKTMISDFEKNVSAEKLTVIFGLFGYDWKVDNQGKSTEPGDPLTLSEIEHSNMRLGSHAVVKTDSISSESQTVWTESTGQKHVIWYESSLNKKEEFLKEKGIESIAYWAYSYY